MLKWYENIYCAGDVDPWAVMQKINSGSYNAGVYLVTISANEKEQLDILRSSELSKKEIEKRCGMIIGIGKTRQNTYEIVAELAEDVLAKTGTCDIRGYFENMDTGAF